MNRKIFDRQRAERFAQLLDEANGVRRHHVRSRVDDELAELVALGRQVRRVPQPSAEVDPEFRAGLRAMLVATAEREGIGAATHDGGVPKHATRTSASAPAGRGLLSRPALNARRARARGAIVIGVAVGAIAVSGISAASENALPGDALYGMKRSTERAQLALASSDLSRGQLFLDFARTRLAEAEAVQGDSQGFAAVLDDMDADTRQSVKLLTTSGVQRRDLAALDAIDAFLINQHGQIAGLLDGATRTERERISMSLALLDSIKKRSDGLRAALLCGTAPSTRTDALGPLPQSCPSGKGASSSQPDDVRGPRPATPSKPR